MKPKKNPKADLSRRWVLFLQIGLILVLSLTLQAFQWKTYDSIPPEDEIVYLDMLEEEEPPVTIKPVMTPPTPPRILNDIIIEVPDDIEEDSFVNTDLDLEDLPSPDDIIEPNKPEEPIKVPFDFIEDVPVFPG
ncbi:MAG: energy transducer TonB, partial [Gramella sp.]|nr:energy transducer TonB [Christiangramia sp.]